MQIDLDTLPDDPAILQRMLRDVVATAAHQHGALQAENDKLRLLVEGGPISGHLPAMRRSLRPPTIQRPDLL